MQSVVAEMLTDRYGSPMLYFEYEGNCVFPSDIERICYFWKTNFGVTFERINGHYFYIYDQALENGYGGINEKNMIHVIQKLDDDPCVLTMKPESVVRLENKIKIKATLKGMKNIGCWGIRTTDFFIYNNPLELPILKDRTRTKNEFEICFNTMKYNDKFRQSYEQIIGLLQSYGYL